MPAANIRLGERKGGLSDVQSLNRELDSLRGYRDVLHDTMKGLVEQAAGRLPAGEFPELASSLDKVAGFLAALAHSGLLKGPASPLRSGYPGAKRFWEFLGPRPDLFVGKGFDREAHEHTHSSLFDF